MKPKSTKSALLMSFTSLLLCFAMLIGCTFAWFTDSVTSGVTRIVAGNLDVEVTHSNAKVTDKSIKGEDTMFPDKGGKAMLWEPGAMSYENFTVKNVGNLALKYNMAMNVVAYNSLESHNLTEVLKVKVLEGAVATPTRESVAAMDWNTSQTLADFAKEGGRLYPAGTAGQSSEDKFQMIVYWEPTDNDNLWNANNGKHTSDGQPLFINFGVTVVATQLEHEYDSFDNLYDASAQAPNVVMPSWSGEATATMPESGPATLEYKVSSTTYARVTVPAGAMAGGSTLEADDNLKLTVVPSTTPTGVVVDSGESVTTYDVSLVKVVSTTEGGETTTEVTTAEGGSPVTVELNIGIVDLQNFSHKGVALTKVDSVGAVDGLGKYYYDQSTGIVTFMTDSFSPFSAVYKFAGGLGTKAHPYLIANAEQLKFVSRLSLFPLYREVENSDYYCYKLIKDIDTTSENWIPIGYAQYDIQGNYQILNTSTSKTFYGDFDGDGHTIKIKLTDDEAYDLENFGLFGNTTESYIHDFILDANVVTTNKIVIGAVSVSDFWFSTFENITVNGSLKSKSSVDGFSRFAYCSTYKNCVNNANITVEDTSNRASSGDKLSKLISGFVGEASTYSDGSEGCPVSFINCVNNGSITMIDNGQHPEWVSLSMGAICGQSLTSDNGWGNAPVIMKNCSNTGVITGCASAYGANPRFETTKSDKSNVSSLKSLFGGYCKGGFFVNDVEYKGAVEGVSASDGNNTYFLPMT